jgi:hypothetical protein
MAMLVSACGATMLANAASLCGAASLCSLGVPQASMRG